MPPKCSKPNAPSKKTEMKKKEKIIEDKTFGLKNKKGSKQQKFIQQVQKQVTHGNNKSAKQLEKEKDLLKHNKDAKKQALLEINQIFRPVQQSLQEGVDPKSVLCAFFKQGQCSKAAKCKFSHDLMIERKVEKRNVYEDTRKEKETNEDWDEETLKEVVEKKHGKSLNRPTTTIVCKYFLDAVESGKYGWFWECPNKGENCIYKHALPPGYVLKKDRKRMEKQKEIISLEDLIERERAALGLETTKITLVTFLAWKKSKLKEKYEKDTKDTDKKKLDYKSGKEGGISGREMFTFNPELADKTQDDEEDDAEFDLRNMEAEEIEEGEDRFQFKEIDFNSLIKEYQDNTIEQENVSIADPDRLKYLKDIPVNSDDNTLENGTEGAVAIDEDLFGGEDEDLDELQEELEEMAVS